MTSPRRLALYGGSFDPVHNGHLQVARTAQQELALDLVLFIPCRQSPHTQDGTVASETERLEMLELATADLPWAEVSEIEMLLPPPSYSWVTAAAIREVYPESRLFWLMGADQWAVIETWHRPAYLADLVEFIVHDRGDPPEPRVGFRTHFIHGDHSASATAIRTRAANALPSDWLPPKVERYIRSRGLYGCSS
jgi:nicotinate-nucleotide adenylyltransferase